MYQTVSINFLEQGFRKSYNLNYSSRTLQRWVRRLRLLNSTNARTTEHQEEKSI